jgi:hypothetical protein
MDWFFVLILVACTSMGAYEVTRWNRKPSIDSLREALRTLVDWVGTFSLFFAANLLLGVLVVFLIRTFTTRFIPLYALENLLLIVLSAAQAFVFHHWWKHD